MRAELQRLGVAVAALIAREVREAVVGRRDELLGIAAEGPGAAEGAGELREPLLPALELLRCGGAVVAPEHPEHPAEGYTGDLIALALEGVQNPLVERGDAQRASHGCQTISTAGGGRIFAPRAASAPPTSGWPAGPAARACRRGRHRARRPSARRAAADLGTPSCWRWMVSVLANTAQRLCQLALMRGEPAAAQRAVPDAPLAGRKRKSRNLGFLRIIGDFLCAQKVTRRRHGHADSPTNSPPKTHDSQPFTI